jgi:hypothetical protein
MTPRSRRIGGVPAAHPSRLGRAALDLNAMRVTPSHLRARESFILVGTSDLA